MAIEKRDVRQWPLSDVIRVTYDELANGTHDLAALQGGEMVVGGSITVVTAWTTTGTATIKLGDEDDDDRYTSAAVDLKTAARTALTLTGHVYDVAADLIATVALADTGADAGEAVIEFTILREGRQSETA